MIRKFFKKIVQAIFSILPLKNTIIFESGHDFSDNSRAIYEEMLKYNIDDKYKMIWFVENKEKFINSNKVKFYQINPQNIIEFLIKYYYCATAKYCFYTNQLLGFECKKNQIRYYLTHSPLPLKNSTGLVLNYKCNTYIEVISEFAAKYRCKTLGGGLDRIKCLGLPRNDYLFKTDNSCLKKLHINENDKLIIWMPTFKHYKNNKKRNDFSVEKEEDITLLTKENLCIINEFLCKNKSFLIVKFHPAQDMKFVKSYKFTNIIFLTNENLDDLNINLYTLMACTDALITDFSSVYVDYLLTRKPIAFELTDKALYEKGIGFTMENPLDFMPGDKIENINDFMNFISNIVNNKDPYEKEREEFTNKIHKFKDGESSKRILKELRLI